MTADLRMSSACSEIQNLNIESQTTPINHATTIHEPEENPTSQEFLVP
jgi:hypothetical protein